MYLNLTFVHLIKPCTRKKTSVQLLPSPKVQYNVNICTDFVLVKHYFIFVFDNLCQAWSCFPSPESVPCRSLVSKLKMNIFLWTTISFQVSGFKLEWKNFSDKTIIFTEVTKELIWMEHFKLFIKRVCETFLKSRGGNSGAV